MFRLSELPRQTPRPEHPRSDLKTPGSISNRDSHSRAGRAFTEVVLIVLVPCFCLMTWALCDAELKKSLMAGPNKDNLLSVNPVYDTVNMENDTVLTVQGQGQLRIWDLKKSTMLGEMQSHLSEVRCAAYSIEARLLAVGSAMGKLEIWNLDHPEMPILTDDPLLHEVSDCVFTPDGRSLLTSGEDGKLVLWDPQTLERRHTLETAEPREAIRSLGISQDGKTVVAGSHSGLVQVWDLNQRTLLRTHRVAVQHLRPQAAVESVTILGDGHNFIAATRNDGVAVWNMETGECIQKFAGDVRGLRSGILAEDGTTFAAGSESGDVVIWNTESGERVGKTLHHPAIVRALASSADGKLLLSGDWNGRVQFHNMLSSPLATEVARR